MKSEETFGKRLKMLRKEKGLTQKQLAEAVHLDATTITKYETEKIGPSIPMIKVFKEFFNVSADFMLGWED